MKKILFLSLAMAMSVSMFAQEKKNVEFSEQTHDFGTVVQGAENGRIKTVFKFKNISASPIVITDAKASCGCTTPNVEKNKLIAPGEYGEVPVTYDSQRVGSFNKQITVTFGIGTETFQEVLHIKGLVNAKPQDEQTAATPAAQQQQQAPLAKQELEKTPPVKEKQAKAAKKPQAK